MNGIKQLADDIDRERWSRAASMGDAERLVEGLRMWHESLEWMKAGVRHRHPAADDAEVMCLVRKQLDQIRRVNEEGLYRPVKENK